MGRDKIQQSVKLATTQTTQFYPTIFVQVKLSVLGMTHFLLLVDCRDLLRKTRSFEHCMPENP
jgi:hypothetical protein|tara:strand:- start:148 stop:336 length:189 start_codon:yes stop_codon:yes gene_type:complete